jgi:hypothetical protein
VPRIDWLPPEIDKGAKSLERTGITSAESPHWKWKRQPLLLESNRPGLFAPVSCVPVPSSVSPRVGEGFDVRPTRPRVPEEM